MIRQSDIPGIRVEMPAEKTVQGLARTIAAIANSGGGTVVLRGAGAAGEVSDAVMMIVPVPVVRGGQADAVTERGSLVIRPPEVALHAEKGCAVLTVTPGDSLCTVGGTVYVLEEGEVRPLSITEVVKRLGSGG